MLYGELRKREKFGKNGRDDIVWVRAYGGWFRIIK